jgi:hypothetical protein
MKPFSLEKWYYDFLSPSGEYFYFYYVIVEVFGLRKAQMEMLLFDSSGIPELFTFSVPCANPRKHDLVKIINIPGYGEIRAAPNVHSIKIDTVDHAIDVTFVPNTINDAEPLIIPVGNKRKIFWKPIIIRADVEGTVRFSSKTLAVKNTFGYADYLSSDVLPYLSPERRLYWGRFHTPEASVVYTHVETANIEKSDSVVYLQTKNKTFSTINGMDLKLIAEPYGKEMKIQCGLDSNRLSAEIHSHDPVVMHDFGINNNRHGGLFRTIVNLIAGSTRGTKYISLADIEILSEGNEISFKDIQGISEFVEFLR